MERGCRIYEGCMVSQIIKGYHVRSDEIEKEIYESDVEYSRKTTET